MFFPVIPTPSPSFPQKRESRVRFRERLKNKKFKNLDPRFREGDGNLSGYARSRIAR